MPKLKKTESEKRKSCLRVSKISLNTKDILTQSQGLKRSSGFLDIKNIDGNFIPSSHENIEAEKPAQFEAKSSETNKTDSDS